MKCAFSEILCIGVNKRSFTQQHLLGLVKGLLLFLWNTILWSGRLLISIKITSLPAVFSPLVLMRKTSISVISAFSRSLHTQLGESPSVSLWGAAFLIFLALFLWGFHFLCVRNFTNWQEVEPHSKWILKLYGKLSLHYHETFKCSLGILTKPSGRLSWKDIMV